MTGLLEGKIAIVYGAGGRLGSAVAGTFCREGANVVLAGRTEATLREAAEAAGGPTQAAYRGGSCQYGGITAL